ncbi:MAG: DUF4446 family protein [Solirubrobacteraceae bacterium]
MTLAGTLTDTPGIVALAAAGAAVLALLCCLALAIRLRRLLREQRVVLGHGGARDLAEHAAGLQQAFEELRDYVTDVAEGLEARLARAETSLCDTISYSSLVHFDAYNELSGRQSVSIALLDSNHSGVVLTCIHHRDQARVYAKELRGGQGDRELSPEEAEAVRLALASPRSAERSPGPGPQRR